ncbi:MAG: hypothetical protein HQK50_09790 [Oligoflexia bacterium]|nr:hypothetical protein [Oligoflexia bacterium]MBF0365854.1 hypothetical protein [Oligoflexia bacterium]
MNVENSKNNNVNSTVIVVIAFIVISSVVALIFSANKNKIKVDQVDSITEKLKTDIRVAKTLKVHQDLTNSEYRVKPLLTKLTKAYCPGESAGYLPLCSRCNVPMEKTTQKNVFRCPSCGQETTIPCPHDHNAKMVHLENSELSALSSFGTGYICPVCGSIDAPLWNNQGAPVCPYCKNIMQFYKNGF